MPTRSTSPAPGGCSPGRWRRRGGLKIQTIHAFCDALLRRFPLEAGVSPRFEVIDERQSALMIAAIKSGMARDAEAGTDTSFDGVAERLNEGGVDDLIGAVLAGRAEFSDDGIDDRLAAHFGVVVREDAEALAGIALDRVDWAGLGVLAVLLADGGKGDKAAAMAIGEVRALREAAPLEAAWRLAATFTTKAGEPRSRRGFPVKKIIDANPEAGPLADEMIGWACEFLDTMRTRESAARARDLDAFANSLLTRYRQAKDARALLDFDDLVTRASGLLTRSDMAAWALYRLDRGIDHILVDEAQDTSPGQWAVIRAIAHEFNTGEGASAVNRTLFVVGDEKQSIYSFQGAEPQAFGKNRQHFADWLEGMESHLARPDLVTSFRSAPGILSYVDAVFAGEAAAGLTVSGDAVTHEAHRDKDASRVDLWPLVEADEAPEPQPWEMPVDTLPPGSAKVKLARMLAGEIGRMISEDRLPAKAGRPGRRVCPGDILVLVTRRDALAQGLIRELKGRGLAVAGSDRLNLAEELTVKDLLALVKVAVTPGDDLSLAALLRSPLCDVSEDALFALAHGRGGTLWQAVMAGGALHGQTVEMLRDMAGRADFLRPYEFLERALIHHDGRCRLLARLGHEAEDPIDELLAQALAFEAREAPSLTGFIAWIEAGDIKVKREMERGAGEIRVMTVHGAKGLEAPVVILPDTMAKPGGGGRPKLFPVGSTANQPPLMLWAAAKAEDDPLTRAARSKAEARDAAERKRLLYVALTRAEDWLILCGAGQESTKPGSWYEALQNGMAALGGGAEIPGPDGLAGPVLRRDDNPVPKTELGRDAPETEERAIATPRPATPHWLTGAPHEERAKRISPSGFGEHVEEGGAGPGRAMALTRGSAVHLLLEKLAGRSTHDREALAGRLLAREFSELPAEIASGVVAEALAVLDAPFAGEVFGMDSLAEAGMALNVPMLTPNRMLGRIDRLIIGPERVLVVDFKTDARPPASAKETPPGYLAQLACYRIALAALYPDHVVDTAILWTAGPALMPLDRETLDRAIANFTLRNP